MREGTKINYKLADRIALLPAPVVQEIRGDFLEVPHSNYQRFRSILNDKVCYLKAVEAQVFIKHTGCTLKELLDPAIDLVRIFHQRVYLREKHQEAASFGLEPSSKVA